MIMTDLNIAFEVRKAVTPIVLAVLAWYAKGLLASVKAVEKDINQIKVTIAEQASHHTGLVERIETNEYRHNSMEARVIRLGEQVAVLEAKI